MSKSGHFLTAAALAYAVYERSGSPTLALGTLLGSSFPDISEIVKFRGRWRTSLIPHRTLTHWIPLYILVIVAMCYAGQSLPWRIESLVIGVCFGSILHVVLDMFSPAGIPLLYPFGARRSFGFRRSGGKNCLYRTGTSEELPVIATAVFGIVGFFAPHPPPFSFRLFEVQSFEMIAALVRAIGDAVVNVLRHL